MNKVSIKLAATCLTMSLGSQAMSYAQEPDADLALSHVDLVQVAYADHATDGDGMCTQPISYALMTLLGVSETDLTEDSMTVACVGN